MTFANPTEPLVRMANQIGQFFDSMPDAAEARQELATHIRNFWEPRMRRRLLEHLDSMQGAGLSEFVLQALRVHRGELAPAA